MPIDPIYIRHLAHAGYGGSTFFVTKCVEGAFEERTLKKERGHVKRLKDYFLYLSRPESNASKSEVISAYTAYKTERRRLMALQDQVLDTASFSPVMLARPAVSDIIFRTLSEEQGNSIWTHAICLMSNHYHWVFDLFQTDQNGKALRLPKFLQKVHSKWAIEINRLDGAKGRKVWQDEAYDVTIRDQRQMDNAINYTLNNPVKAGLCKSIDEYEFTLRFQ